ncbi:hypothetical protein IIW29_00320, partial [Candidatus Saccharibacteria bacterium]|nr:hypothetical protein [Candidatus Saccharibacteria bacterium]
CPIGWRLPTGNTNSGTTRITDYGTLYSAYASATLGQGPAMRNALSTPLSGYFNGSQSNLGTPGWFWSSTWANTSSMYNFYANSTGANPSSTNNRYNGYSIRCVLGSS